MQEPSRSEPLSQHLLRQIHAMDAWNAFRQQRERQLSTAVLSRDEQMLARFEMERLLRTHAAAQHRASLALTEQAGTSRSMAPTVVIAHRSPWFCDRVEHALTTQGLRVLASTGNGAEALGVIIAEQPDCVFAGARLAMLAGDQLVAQVRWYSPLSQLFVHVEEGSVEPFERAGCVVLTSRHRPIDVADAIGQLASMIEGRTKEFS